MVHDILRRIRVRQPGWVWRGLLPVLAVALAGCASGLLPKPAAPPARFTLDGAPPADARPSPGADIGPVLVLVVPQAAPGYETARMVYLRRAQALEHFAFHEWVDTPARMLAPLMLHTLQDSGRFAAVVLSPSLATGSLRLESELVRLHQDFRTVPSTVRLTLRVLLVDSATRRVLGWQEIDETVPADADDPVGGVAAASLASQRVLARVLAFCAEHQGR